MNTFLGVELGIQVAERLAVMQEDLSEPLRQLDVDVRWTPAQQMRVLLKDFGHLTEGQRERLQELLRAYAKATRAFHFEFTNLHFFPSVETPQMIIADIHDDSGLLEALRTNIEKAAEPLGFRQDRVPWRSSVLIGRLMTAGRAPDLRGVLNNWSSQQFGDTSCRELVLFGVERFGQRARTRTFSRYELGTGR